MTFPGLSPTFVIVPNLEVIEGMNLDSSRESILFNPKTFYIIQAQEGGAKAEPPEGFVDFRNFSNDEFETIVSILDIGGMPIDMIQELRKYRARF